MHDKHSHGADAFRTMVMGIHLNLVHPYLSSEKKISLPNSVGQAESYTDWNEQIEDKEPLWKTFRNLT